MPSSLVHGKYLVCRAGSDAESTVVFNDGAFFQRDGAIEAVGRYDSLKESFAPDEVLGGPDYIVFPGLVNCHHHGRGVGTFQMGACDDSLETWILSGWGRRPQDNYLMTAYTALQMLESGTTTVMYNHPQTPVSGLEDDVDQILRGFADAGMRTAFSVYFRERNRVVYGSDEEFIAGLPRDLAQGLSKYLSATNITAEEYFNLFRSIYEKHGRSPNGKVRVLLSPANVQWVSDEFLQQTSELAAEYRTGIHMHLAESLYQKEFGHRTWGVTPVAHLDELGFLGPGLSCAHAVWLTEPDIELLAHNGTTVCHNASSNLRLKNGIAPVLRMAQAGVNIAMGTDSTAINDDDDMLQEMRLVSRLHREPGLSAPALTSHAALSMATINAAAPTFFHREIGALEPGRRADAVLLNLANIQRPYLDPDIDPVDGLLYRGKAGQVDTVMIDGEVVLRNGIHTRLDKTELLRELTERYSRPLEPQVREARTLVQGLLPYVERFYQDWRTDQGPPHYTFNSRG